MIMVSCSLVYLLTALQQGRQQPQERQHQWDAINSRALPMKKKEQFSNQGHPVVSFTEESETVQKGGGSEVTCLPELQQPQI
jgi:hypothetical protein